MVVQNMCFYIRNVHTEHTTGWSKDHLSPDKQ